MVLDNLRIAFARSATQEPREKRATSITKSMSARPTPKRSSKEKFNQTARTNVKLMLMQRRKGDRLSRIPATSGMVGQNLHEVKGVDVPKDTYNFNHAIGGTNNQIYLMNAVQMGDGFWNREGNKINMKNLHIRGYLHPRVTQVTPGENEYLSSPGELRMVVVYDRGPTGVLPNLDEVFRSHDQAGSATTDISSEINMNNRARFAIIRSKSWFIPSFAYNISSKEYVGAHPLGFVGEEDPYTIDEFIKLKELVTVFKGNANPLNITHVATGALYLILIKSGSDVHMAFEGGWRIRYDDQ